MALVKHTNLRELPVGVEHTIYFENLPAGLLVLNEDNEVGGGIDPILLLAINAGCEVFLEKMPNPDRANGPHENYVKVSINPPGTHPGNVE